MLKPHSPMRTRMAHRIAAYWQGPAAQVTVSTALQAALGCLERFVNEFTGADATVRSRRTGSLAHPRMHSHPPQVSIVIPFFGRAPEHLALLDETLATVDQQTF